MKWVGPMLRRRAVGVAVLFLALAVPASRSRAADTAVDRTKDSPRQIIQSLVDASIEVLRDAKLSPEEKTAKIQQFVYADIDFPTVARLTLSRHWRDLSEKQQADFVEAYKQHLSRTYANIGREYKNQKVEITSDRDLGRGDWLVQSRVVGEGGGATKVDYRLRQKDGRWYAIDMIVEGQSMVLNFRAQFDDLMQQGGYDRLMKALREKNDAAGK